ncbi:VC0807 family protein [uncultured Rummeliibacillus sp.]|uniref:VC0807 family protein n=1 Tax=uncultured Rummeliibacillus sp. TaxID=762292 RepID=UPI002634A391|nr:VC0807 family protein [uncultured Rummeliibacillus sp.]
MQKNIPIFDMIFYFGFPLLIWHFSRNYIGDYYAMLLSSVPGIIYSIIRFILLKKLNFLGLFMISNLVVGTLIDVLSGSAMQLQWNNVYYAYFISFLSFTTIIINRPLYLYFALDFVEMQGYNRKLMKKLYYQKKILRVFKWITFGFTFKEVLLATIKVWLIKKYGVDAFDKGIIIRQIIGWGLSGISFYGFIYISKLLQEQDNNAGNLN